MKSDLDIARETELQKISDIAAAANINEEELFHYGPHMAKVSLDMLERRSAQKNGRYIVMTAMTPTPLGEGKTVNTIGLSLGLHRRGHKIFTCLRQPSLGPVFGIKGGAAGGGHAQVLPMEDINLHLTGDVHAVSIANNLLAAAIDTSLLLKNPLDIDPQTITWHRGVDVNDRALRSIVVGLGGKKNGVPRETQFDISVASEVMAVLAMTRDLKDMRERFGRMIIGRNRSGDPVTAEDLKAAGSLTVLMKKALEPNLLQTTEGTPAFIHAGPFANIAHGNSSILSDRMALKCADYVVTEAGFGADMGAEKFFNIKCRASGLKPNAAGLVVTLRALKLHGSQVKIVPGKDLPKEVSEPNVEAIRQGAANMVKQIANVRAHGVPVVVALNRFPGDQDDEIALVRELAKEAGAFDTVVSEVFTKGGAGGEDFAEAIERACDSGEEFKPLYPDDMPVEDKIRTIATQIYGADAVSWSAVAKRKLKDVQAWGLNGLPVCMAKTQYSLSHDPALRGAPKGFTLPIQDIRIKAGAGFVVALCGDIMRMPGYGSKPAMHHIDIDEKGQVTGLF